MQRLRSSGPLILRRVGVPNVKRKALNSWSAVQDTFFSTKEIFERHKVVFTIATSIASVATAWAGYTIRYVHQARVDQRLESIEKAMKSSHHIQQHEIEKIVSQGKVSTAACVATAGTTLVLGYGLGLRGGIWYANRQFRKEQLKLMGQLKPRKWQLKFLRRPFTRGTDSASKCSETLQKNATTVPVKDSTVSG